MRRGLVPLLALLALVLHAAGPGESRAADPIAAVDSLWSTGARAEAFAEGERSLAAARAARDSTTLARLLVQRGAQMLSVGEALSARPLLDEALLLSTALGDSLLACQAIRWQSVAQGVLGQAVEARRLYEELLDCAIALGAVDLQGWAHVGMGWDAAQIGEYTRSEEHNAIAVELFAEIGNGWGESWARNGLAIAQRNLGDLEGARASYLAVVEQARAQGATMAEGMGLNNLASLEWTVGDPGRAMEGYMASAQLHERLGQRREALVPRINLARCLATLGDATAAQDTLRSCLDLARSMDNREHETMALTGLGSVFLQQEDWAEATRSYREALRRGRGLNVPATRNAMLGLATALAHQDSNLAALQILQQGRAWCGDEADAVFCARLELAIADRQLEQGEEGVRRALVSFRLAERSAAELGIQELRVGAFTGIAAARRELGQPGLALQALRDAVEVWEEERSLPEDPEWRAIRGSQGRRLFTELAAALLDEGHGTASFVGADSPGGPEQAFDELQRYKGRTLIEHVEGPLGAGSAPGWNARVDLARLQKQILEPGELLLDAYLGPTVSIIFAVDDEDCLAWRLPGEAELTQSSLKLRRLIEERGLDAETFGLVTAAIMGDLFAPGAAMIARNQHIFLSADGVLHLLPPALLTESTGKTWSRVPSAGLLARLRDSVPRAVPPAGILVLASPSGEGRVRLPAVEEEARWLDSRFEGVESATEAFRGRQVLHLAAHAVADDARPWRSRLELGDGRELPASRLLEEGSDARLAVLASCGTARGRSLSGEGVQSLSTALLGGGVPCVVATLWPVDDEATYALMRHFYRQLEKGHSAMFALQEAQTALRANPATSQPFYWAAFVLEGEPTASVDLSARGDRGRLLLLALLCALVAGGVFFRRGV